VIPDAELLLLLQEEREKQPDLAQTLELYLDLAAAKAEAAADVSAEWPERARRRLERGKPALSPDELELDYHQVQKLIRKICEIAAEHRPELSEAFARIASGLGHAAVNEKETRSLVAAYLEQRDGGLEVEPELFHFVMNQALHPVLQAYAVAVAPVLAGMPWLWGNCPVCGGHPDFAALEGSAGGRRLLCARCDSEWTYRRIGCPFCDNEDPTTLGYFTTGDGAYRLYVCERCKGYLKTIDMREMRRARPLPLERILTVAMDLAAAADGYRRMPEARSPNCEEQS